MPVGLLEEPGVFERYAKSVSDRREQRNLRVGKARFVPRADREDADDFVLRADRHPSGRRYVLAPEFPAVIRRNVFEYQRLLGRDDLRGFPAKLPFAFHPGDERL